MAQTKKDALVNIAASQTDSNIVSGVSGKAIRVVQIAMVSGATSTNVTFNTKPSGSGTAISCLFANGANGGAVLNYNSEGWFTTNAGEGLSVTTGAGSTTGIQVGYLTI